MPLIDRRDPETIRLGKHLHAMGTPRWAHDYLNAAQLLIERLELDTTDLRLNMSVPKRTSGFVLPVTINHRYVLAVERRAGERAFAAIWGPAFEHIPHLRECALRVGRFEPLAGEDVLDPPYFVRFRDPRDLLDDDELREGWLAAARLELERASASPYRRFHSPTVFRVVTEPAARERVMGEVWRSA